MQDSFQNPDGSPNENPRRSVMLFTLVAGTCAAALPVLAVVILLLARNPELDSGIDVAVAFRLATWLTLSAGALWTLVELAQPDGSNRPWQYLLPAPIILGSGVAAEFARSPSGQLAPRMMSSNPAACVAMITLFSLPILTSVFYVLRSVALRAPRLSGAAAGLLAGGISASIYAWHCPERSLLFGATWDAIAVLLAAGIGTVLGRKYLRRAAE